MSRRGADPAAERAAKNQQTIKQLLKLEGNKTCADCKRNKHPRWASWNLGVFICIRCSGIHRGMGTHISRVKSVDLDAWTDEQLQSILRWGNSRANKYWEAKLAVGHAPSEAKIENFIRTKYDSKRWVMDGGIPDPATLDDEGDEDIPLSLVQEKQKLSPSSTRSAATSSQPSNISRAPQNVDLFADDMVPATRTATVGSTTASDSPKRSGPQKSSRPGDSLLGLDFFGSSTSTAPLAGRSSSTANTSGTAAMSSRPDLKQSILSLYAAAPKLQPQPQQQQSTSGAVAAQQQSSQSSMGGMNDAFSGLNFGGPKLPVALAQTKSTTPFGNLGSFGQKSTPAAVQTSNAFAGGDFFNSTPQYMSASSSQVPPANRGTDFSNTFGALDSSPSVGKHVPSNVNSNMDDFIFSSAAVPKNNDILNFSATESVASPAANAAAPAPTASVFNLSSTQPTHKSAVPPLTTTATAANASSGAGWGGTDAWGSEDVWSTPESNISKVAVTTSAPMTAAATSVAMSNDFGWGSSGDLTSGSASGGIHTSTSGPKVTADDDFGGWNSAPPVQVATAKPAATASAASGGSVKPFGTASEDLFSNVWE